MDTTGTVLIYTNRLLPYSETFIRDHGRGLSRYRPYYAGCRRVAGIELPAHQMAVLNETNLLGALREARFKLRGKAPAFVNAIRAQRPSILHAHFGDCAAVALPLADALQVPMVVTFHGVDATRHVAERLMEMRLTPKLYLLRRERLKRRVDLFLTVTHHMREVLVAQGFPAGRIAVHNLGIDTQYFRPDPAVGRSPLVLFVGRLVEKKGCIYLIRAMARVQRVRPDVELVVIGDGRLRTSLERQAARTLRRYRFLGRQSPEEVRRWMNRAMVFSVPSIVAASGDREGFGIVFLEAQAMGTPVASFASGGIPESVADGVTGLLAAEKDVTALSVHLLRLLEDRDLWERFSRQGVERIRRQFDLYGQGAKLEAVYDRVLAQHAFGTAQLQLPAQPQGALTR